MIKRRKLALPVSMVAAMVAAVSAPAFAETSYNFSVTPLYLSDAKLDEGGKIGLSSISLNAGARWNLNAVSNLGLQFNFANDDWRFESPTGFTDPWKGVSRYGFSLPFAMALSESWRLTVTPNVGWAAESGASPGDSLTGGISGGAFKIFGPGKVLGVGLGVFSNVDQVRAFPFVIVDWKFDDHWRLANPLQVGPTGPAGLELSYDMGNGWDFGAGGAWRSLRFRLDDQNPNAPKGVGEVSSFPVFARAGYRSANGWRLDGYVGGNFGGGLRIENADGDELRKEDFNPSALLGLTLSLDF